MPTTAKIEEYIKEVARAVGDAYIGVRDGIGSEDTPGSALFEMAQLRDLASKNLPRFGILESTPDGFTVTYDNTNDPTYVTVSSGLVAYNGQRLSVEPQRVPIVREHAKFYDNTHQYGVKLGFPLSEAKKASQAYSTVVSQSSLSTDKVLYVADLNVPIELGFPLKAHVGTSFIVFSGLNSTGTALQVDPGFTPDGSTYGVLGEAFLEQTRVYFIYEPRIQAIAGVPVTSSGTDPGAFLYYPPMPSDWLPVADVLVTCPSSGTEPTAAYIERTVVEWPQPDSGSSIFDTDDAKKIVRVTDTARSSLRQMKTGMTFGDVVAALQDYTVAVSDNSDISFRAYWAKQPFRDATYFARGVGFHDLERLEFPDSFARLYYDSTGEDLQHTFAIFRGDLYDNTAPIYNNSIVSSVTLRHHIAGSVPSMLRRGTYVYGVSAVVQSGGDYAETPVKYITSTTNTTEPNYFVNELSWPAVTDAVFYHIYRRATIAGDQSESRLTDVAEVTGSGTHLIPTDTMGVAEYLGATYDAFKFTVGSNTSIHEVELEIKASVALTGTGTDHLTINLCADNSGVPGAFIKSGGTIPFADITTSYQVFTKPLAYTLTTGTYWIVLGRSAAPSSPLHLHRGALSGGVMQGQVVANGSGGNKVQLTPSLTSDELLHEQAQAMLIDTSAYSGTPHLGGVSLKLSRSSTIKNKTDALNVYLYSNDGSNKPGTLLATGTPISYNDLKLTPGYFISQFDYTMAAATKYWIVVGRSSPPLGARIATYIAASGSGAYATSPDGDGGTGTWTLVNTKTGYLRLHSWLDYGREGLYQTRRGLRLTGKVALEGRRLSIYVPPVEIVNDRGRLPDVSQAGEDVDSTESTVTKNELVVTVTARLGANGAPVTMPSVTIPKGTPRDTRFLLGTESDLFDRIDEIHIRPGASLTLSSGVIKWSVYDLITVETVP